MQHPISAAQAQALSSTARWARDEHGNAGYAAGHVLQLPSNCTCPAQGVANIRMAASVGLPSQDMT